jgi:hypothetical protein
MVNATILVDVETLHRISGHLVWKWAISQAGGLYMM